MDFSSLVNIQIMIFIILIVGCFLKRKRIVSEEGKNNITDLVIYVFLPCSILRSFYKNFSIELLTDGFTVLVISIVLQLFCSLISSFLYRRVSKEKRKVLQYGTICSNAGFLGNPVAEGIYGPLGLLYASIYLIPLRIVMWSAGLSYFTESPDRKTVIKKILMHPCIIAVEAGVVLMALQITLPVYLDKAIASLGGCSTPISMLVIGMILAEVDLKSMFNKMIGFYSFIRLILIPLAVFAACYVCRIDPLVTGVSVVLAGMPAGSTTAILATKYDGDAPFATRCVMLTTILSMVTIPVWCVAVKLLF